MHEEKSEKLNQNSSFSEQNPQTVSTDNVVSHPEIASAINNTTSESYTNESNKNNKGFYLIVAVIALILVVAGGAYIYMNNNESTGSQKQMTAMINPSTKTAVATTNDSQSSLTDQLNALNLGNLDSDFSTVDQNLKSL